MDDKDQNSKEQKQPIVKPDEIGGINLEGHIKIFDPETNEIFVNERA